ncbi:MAG: GGDEF domain-containing protein [Clostridia bacterium]|nr:GGDEF domain-containing protein [Clostridia bacterium]
MRYNISTGKNQYSMKTIMLIISALLMISCLLVVLYGMRAKVYNEKSIELSKLHMKYTDIATSLTDGSHTLTEQVRLFAETGDISHLYLYFEEAKVDKHRDKAMEELAKTSVSMEAAAYIETSMNYSVKLMNREYYSMKLAALAYGIPDSELPEEVSGVVLKDEDRWLSAEQMKEKARIMLLDDEYMNTKKLITDGTSRFLDSAKENSKNEYIAITNKVELYSNALQLVIAIMFISIVFMTVIQYKFVIRPIADASWSIRKGQRISMPDFLEEMEALTTAYNGLLDKNAQLVEELRETAETDSLTGLGNRTSYGDFCNKLFDEGGEATMFVFDVNDLRKMNNISGHKDGDKLLKKAAECILSVFGKENEENCFRIGGDEFVAFVLGEDESKMPDYVEKFRAKTDQANIKVAVGYKYEKEVRKTSVYQMFNKADKMMYIDKASLKESE